MKKIFLCIVLFIAVSLSASAQKLTAEKILQEVKNHFETVKDYSVELTAEIEMERLHIPEMKMKLYFKQPDKIHIDSKNFAMLPKEGFGINPAEYLEHYNASITGTETVNGTTLYTLKLLSKPEKNKPLREVFLTVDGAHWVVIRMESSPAPGRTIFVAMDYAAIENIYFLPVAMKLQFDFAPPADTSLTEKKMNTMRMMPRKGRVEISYSKYKVNTGLSDGIFEKKEK